MTFSYEIFPEREAIHVRYVGTFSLERLIATAKALWADPRYSRDYHGIVDFLHGPVGASMSDLRKLIQFVQQNPQTSRGRWAAVTTAPLPTALALVYGQAMSKHHVFEVFSSWAAACDFLGVEFDPNAPLRTLSDGA